MALVRRHDRHIDLDELNMALLEFKELTCNAGNMPILKNLKGHFGPGAFAMFGENGVGKTTLLHTLSGIRQPRSGHILMSGIDLYRHPVAAKRKMVFMPDRPMVYPGMKGFDLLDLQVRIRGEFTMDSLSNLIDGLHVRQHLDKPFEAMSLGTQKKFLLIGTLASKAPVLLLDEPTNAIDPETRATVIRLLAQRATTSTVLFSTHDRGFAEALSAHHLMLDADGLKSH